MSGAPRAQAGSPVVVTAHNQISCLRVSSCGAARALAKNRELRCGYATVPHGLKPDKTNSQSGHEPLSQGRETIRGTTMRAQRVWKVNGDASIGHLQSKLDDLNKRLGQLESLHSSSGKLEELKASALSLSREIDDIRCAEATAALSELLRK
ncbi:hypothetical protein [Bradyrhizobium sp. CCBAU 53351]|uniref:hypothetical protein n=2 Tax=Nitrobacteraceae TaxID=41294 RepID=UPI001FED8B8B|nr:hypothetical protein [Bradyrhizobium sp. CCBAU 53351]